MALQTEAPDHQLMLPTNFPDGWQEADNKYNKKLLSTDEVDTSMLQITTSRLQQNIR